MPPLLSRRFLLKGGAIAGGVLGARLLPGFARRALALEPSVLGSRKVLAFLFLRGALDGLDVLAPHGEPRFTQLRPTLALPSPRGARKSDAPEQTLLDLGVPGFGLHPALEPLLPLWQEGTLAFVHAVGSPDSTRSHFDAQDFLELGTPGVKGTPDGWMARALAQVPRQANVVDAVAISGKMPRSLQGDRRALAFANLDQLRLRPVAGARRGAIGRKQARETFETLYYLEPDGPIAASGREALAAAELLENKLGSVAGKAAADGYPAAPIGQSLRMLAALIKSDVGLRVGFVDVAGWDTHVQQRAVLGRNLAALGKALAAFRHDLGARIDDVVFVAATEFGRTARQNGTMGTDHGHGSVAFVLGGRVAGGKIHGEWPGLADDRLFEGRDLAVTTDLRAVLAAAARAQLGAADVGRLFPGYRGPVLSGLVHV
ncbi:MAG TPA: DUF1501 domain-containing protein [Myxococcales bacterium]|nr:DUF1501 domain-containing protein [Myxococcales bacterium]